MVDFLSKFDYFVDVASVNGSDNASGLTITSPRGFFRKDLCENAPHDHSSDQQQKPREPLHSKNEGISVSADEVSTVCVDESGGEDQTTQAVDHCCLLPNNCLPRLASTVDKRSPGPQSSRRKPLSRLSFKWREGHADPSPTLCECCTDSSSFVICFFFVLFTSSSCGCHCYFYIVSVSSFALINSGIGLSGREKGYACV